MKEVLILELNILPSLTPNQVAKYCKVSKHTVLRWIAKSKIKSYQLPSRHYRIHVRDFLSFLKEYNMPIPSGVSNLNYKVLVVSDCSSTVDYFQRILNALKDVRSEFHWANNSVQASYKVGLETPDLLFIDLDIGGSDILEIAKEFSSDGDYPDMCIVAMSVNEGPTTDLYLDEAGVCYYLKKPFLKRELEKLVRDLYKGNKRVVTGKKLIEEMCRE